MVEKGVGRDSVLRRGVVVGVLSWLVLLGLVVGVPFASPASAQVPTPDCDSDSDGSDDAVLRTLLSDGIDAVAEFLGVEAGVRLDFIEDPYRWELDACLGATATAVVGPIRRVLAPDAALWEQEAVDEAVELVRESGLVQPGPRLKPHVYGLQVVNLETWLAIDPDVYSWDERLVGVRPPSTA